LERIIQFLKGELHMNFWKRAKLLSLASIASFFIQTAESSYAAGFDLTLNNVLVNQVRENSGDRPYFYTIHFETRLNVANSTRVRVAGVEPHDWVGKAPYTNASIRNGHMQNRQRLNIPWWMGRHGWQGLDLATSPVAMGFAHVFGAIIIGLDNNNTPPHLVQDLMNQIAQKLRVVLREQVETGQLVDGINLHSPTATTQIRQRIMDFSNGLTDDLEINYLDWLFGSTFNPDRLVGIQALVFPSIPGYAIQVENQTRRIAGQDVQVQVHFGSPVNLRRSLIFRGSEAEYIVDAQLQQRNLPDTIPVTHLDVRLRTGSDDLRRSSRAFFNLTFMRGGSLTPFQTRIDGGRGFQNMQDSSFRITLPTGVTLGSIRNLGLSYNGNPSTITDTHDNWDIDALQVSAITPGGQEQLFVAMSKQLLRMTQSRSSAVFGIRR